MCKASPKAVASYIVSYVINVIHEGKEGNIML